VGTRLNDRYEIRGLLGVGGTATVYDAFDLVIHREVALKVVKPFVDGRHPEEDLKSVERFQREARSAAQMIHPNVVTIHDMGVLTETAQPFIVMEKLIGRNVEEELRSRGALSARRALRLIGRALDALSMGHDKGIVHRDLKPANLFIVAPGRPEEDVRVLDFGIAWHGWGTRLSATGQLFGTARYLAPEYLLEQRVSPALDVYQIGLVLVEMLTGTPVMGIRKPGDCIYAHVHGELDVPARLLECPLGPVLQAALARQPELRMADARIFRDVLERVNPNDIPRVSSDEAVGRITEEGTLEAVEALHIGQTGPMGMAPGMQVDPFGDDPTVIGFGGLDSWLEESSGGYGEVTVAPVARAEKVEGGLHRSGSLKEDRRSDHLVRVALEVSARMQSHPRQSNDDDSGGERVVSTSMMAAMNPPPKEDRSDRPVLMPSFGAASRRVASAAPPLPAPMDATVEEPIRVPPRPTTSQDGWEVRTLPTTDYSGTFDATVQASPPPRERVDQVPSLVSGRGRMVVIVGAVIGGVVLLIVALIMAIVVLRM